MSLPKDPQQRTQYLVTALMKAYHLSQGEAEAVLDSHDADKLREVDEELNTLPNPYTRRRASRLWYEGIRAAQQRVFMRELRLLTKVGQALSGAARTRQ